MCELARVGIERRIYLHKSRPRGPRAPLITEISNYKPEPERRAIRHCNNSFETRYTLEMSTMLNVLNASE